MIKRIAIYGFFFCLIIAIPLALMGIKQVELGGPFLAFLKQCSFELNQFKIEIPDIPHIPQSTNIGAGWDILNAFVKFANFIVDFVNIVVDIINIVISLIEYLVIIVKNLITLKDTLASFEVSAPVVANLVSGA